MGCQVCGAGIDWRWYPEWRVLACDGTTLISTPLGFMLFEYLCLDCHSWASKRGVIWNAATAMTGLGFTGWRVKPNGDIAGSVVARTPPRSWVWGFVR